MKEKTSITLSKEVLTGIDRITGSKGSRSAYIDGVLRQHLTERIKEQRAARDLALLNQFADEMNAEAEDVLRYQAPEI